MASRRISSANFLLRTAVTTQGAVRNAVPGCNVYSTEKKNRVESLWPRKTLESQACFRMQRRWHSAPTTSSKLYEYDDVKKLSEKASPSRILIDVREPSEYETGFIPNAMNVPISSQPDALFLPPDEFEERFGFEKPGIDKELVFYCKAGVRSSAAAKLAEQSGYEKIGEYRGSWLDWIKKEAGG